MSDPTNGDDILTVAAAIHTGVMVVTPRPSVQALARAYIALRQEIAEKLQHERLDPDCGHPHRLLVRQEDGTATCAGCRLETAEAALQQAKEDRDDLWSALIEIASILGLILPHDGGQREIVTAIRRLEAALQQAHEVLAIAHGAIVDAIAHEDGLDGLAGEAVMHMIRATLHAGGRPLPPIPDETAVKCEARTHLFLVRPDGHVTSCLRCGQPPSQATQHDQAQALLADWQAEDRDVPATETPQPPEM